MTLRVRLLFLFLLASLVLPAYSQKATAHVSGQAIYALTQQYVNAAPHRYVGSADHAHAEEFIKFAVFAGSCEGDFETDSFAPSTPIGLVAMRNYIVRYPGKKDGVIVLATHYETNYPLKDVNFVGAKRWSMHNGVADRDWTLSANTSA